MSASKQSRVRNLFGRWREWRRVRSQRWVERQAPKRPGDPDQWKPGSSGGPGM